MKTVSIVAVTKKYKQFPFYAFPPWDPSKGKYLTGQEDMAEAERKRQPYVIPLDEGYPVTDKMRLTVCTEPAEVRTQHDNLYEFFKLVPEIASNKRDVIVGVHEFYIFDEIIEAEKNITTAELTFKAMTLLAEHMSVTKMQEIAIFLELPVRNAAARVIEANIKAKAMNEPQRVIDFFNPENEVRIFIMRCIFHGLLVKKANKIFTKNNTFIGDSIMDAVAYLSGHKEENAQIASMLTEQLRDKEVVPAEEKKGKKLDIKEVVE